MDVLVVLDGTNAFYDSVSYANHDAAIQAAIDAVTSSPGGDTVTLGVGAFTNLTRALVLKSGVTLAGSGEGLTTCPTIMPSQPSR